MDLLFDMFGMAKAQVEADRAYRQSMLFADDKAKFEEWIGKYSENYIALRDALNNSSYRVNRKVFHGSFITGKAKADGKVFDEEDDENSRRKNLIERAIKEQSFVYGKEIFKNYLSEIEGGILDSYHSFCMFENEMSYLLRIQKDIVDSIYLNEIKELLGAVGRETALTKIKDFAWQIERHKKPAGHAIVLLVLAKTVYRDNSGFAGDIKAQIEKVLLQAEDIIIDNTYKKYLTDDVSDIDAVALLQTGKDFFIKGEPEKAFAFFLRAGKKGDAEAQYRVGLCFEKGYGVWKNDEKAVFWYKKSAESDNAVSKYYLATVYHWVLSENLRDYNKAFELYLTAFNEGVAEAAENIGNMYANGIGIEKNDVEAVKWYEKGAAAGSPWAMYHLYLAYMNGVAVEANSEMAEKWFTKCVSLFEFSEEGTEKSSVEEDSGSVDEMEEKASEIYGNLFLPGCDSIFAKIAKEYRDGSNIVEKDIDKAISWYKKGAAIGHVGSLYLLADIYFEKGWNADGVKFASRAAEYGCSEAMNKVGICYYNGKGVNRDKVIANIWFLRAAKTGNVWGRRNIAFEFLSGVNGISKDIKEARYWFSLAAEQGNEECKTKLAELDEQDKEKRKQELAKEKEKLEKKRSKVFLEIAEINEKIDAAQSQGEEENLIRQREALEKKIAALDEEIDQCK